MQNKKKKAVIKYNQKMSILKNDYTFLCCNANILIRHPQPFFFFFFFCFLFLKFLPTLFFVYISFFLSFFLFISFFFLIIFPSFSFPVERIIEYVLPF